MIGLNSDCNNSMGVMNPAMLLCTVIPPYRRQNYTCTATAPGFHSFCFFSDITKAWYKINRPFAVVANVRQALLVTQATVNLPIVVNTAIRAANMTHDVLRLIRFGQKCDSLSLQILYILRPTTFDAVSTTFQGVVNDAMDFTACYYGFPFTSPLRSTAINLRTPIRTEVWTDKFSWFGMAPIAGEFGTFDITGLGLTFRDVMYITTAATCDPYAAGTKTFVRQWTDRSPNFIRGRIQPRVPYFHIACYKGNTSKSFRVVGPSIFVRPLLPDGFSPADPVVAGTHAVLRLTGRNLSVSDTMFISTASTCAQRTYPMALADPVNWQYEGFVNESGTLTVCYRSPFSDDSPLGTIDVVPRFYLPDADPAFSNGLMIGDTLNLTVRGSQLTSQSPNRLFLVPNGTSCYDIAPVDPKLQPASTPTDLTVTFLMAYSGYFVVCLQTSRGAAVASDVLPVFPEAPTDFAPRTIGVDYPTAVTFLWGSDMDLSRSDSVFLCGHVPARTAPLPTFSATGVERRVAKWSVLALGTYKVCYSSSVVSRTRSRVTSTLTTSLVVSPVVTSVAVSPSLTPVGATATLAVRGNELRAEDSLYLCNYSATVVVTSSTTGTAGRPATSTMTSTITQLAPASTTSNATATTASGAPASTTTLAPQIAMNTTEITYVKTFYNSSYSEWRVTSNTAGAFSICYAYAIKPSFESGPLLPTVAARSVNFDPAALTFFPTTMDAATPTLITLTGSQLERIARVFIKSNGSDCTDLANPFNIDLQQAKEAVSGYMAVVEARGSYTVCFVGPSGVGLIVPNGGTKLTVNPKLTKFKASQLGALPRAQSANTSTSNGAFTFYSNYPITIDLNGGGLDYTKDYFFAVLGAVCTASAPIQLRTDDPPLGATRELKLFFEAPDPGTYGICYQLSGADAVLVPDPLYVVSGLQYVNASLTLAGPYTIDAGAIGFSVGVTKGYWTLFQTPSAQKSIPVPFVPAGSIVFQAVVYDVSGRVKYTVRLSYDSAATSAACTTIPSAVTETDRLRRFMLIAVYVHNFLRGNCFQVNVDATNALSMGRTLTSLVDTDPSLMTDPLWILPLLAELFSSQREESQRYADVDQMLEKTTAALENMPAASLTSEYLSAHALMTNIAVDMVAKLGLTTARDDSWAQRVSMRVVDRITLIARRHCDRPTASTLFNTTGTVSAVSAIAQPVPVSLSVSIPAGFGIVVAPQFSSATSAPVCIAAAPLTVNPLPQRPVGITSAAAGRRLLQTAATSSTAAPPDSTVEPSPAAPTLPTLPKFNFPVFTYSLPASSGTQPLSQTPQVQFVYRYPPQTFAPSTKLEVEATMYRFQRDSPKATGGEWVADPDSRATVDEPSNSIIVTSNTTSSRSTGVNSNNAAVQETNFLIVSGRFILRPIVIPQPDNEVDLGLAIFLGVLVILHVILCVIGAITDNIRDGRHRPDVQSLLQPQTHLTFHRYISCGSRKPHHPIFTWARVTTLFTFLFSAALFSLFILLASPAEHPAYLNGPLGLGAAALATAPAAISRIALSLHLHDYASGVAAAIAIVAISVGTPLIGPFFAVLVAVGAGVLGFLACVGYFRSRWSFELQARPGPFPMVFGLGVHFAIEIITVVFGMYMAIVVGTPRWSHINWDFFQIVAWALGLDCIILEPLKNALMMCMRNFCVARDSSNDLQRSSLKGAGASAPPTAQQPPTALKSVDTPRSNDGFSSIATTPRSLEEYEIDSDAGDVSFADVNEPPAFTPAGGAKSRSGTQLSGFDDIGSDAESDTAGFDSIDAGTNAGSHASRRQQPSGLDEVPDDTRTPRGDSELDEAPAWSDADSAAASSRATTPGYPMPYQSHRTAPFGRAQSSAGGDSSSRGAYPTRAAFRNAPLPFDDTRSVRSNASTRGNPMEEL